MLQMQKIHTGVACFSFTQHVVNLVNRSMALRRLASSMSITIMPATSLMSTIICFMMELSSNRSLMSGALDPSPHRLVNFDFKKLALANCVTTFALLVMSLRLAWTRRGQDID